jgi:molybdopterin-containing oxidoreductase family membrane subunit
MQTSKTLKRALYGLGGVAFVLGLWGFYSRFFLGERDVNYGSYVNWGLWVAMYLFFAGIATGAYMLATLDYLFKVPLFKGTGKAALWGALITMPAALATIGMDLGHMERIWKVYLQPNFQSVLAQLVWGYTIFALVTLISLLFVLRKTTQDDKNSIVLRALMVVGLFLSIFLSGGVGALLSVNASRESWHTGMLPAQFPVFSLTSGIALMIIILAWFSPTTDTRRPQQLRILNVALIVLLIVKAYYLWTDFSLALYSGIPQSAEAVNLVLFGRYGWAFWILQVGFGMIVPVIVLLTPGWTKNNFLVGLMGVLVLVGMAVARANIVFPALSIPELEGLATAFTGPHLTYDYFPSLMEWSVTLGVLGATTLVFLLGADRLPLFRHAAHTEVAS